MTDEDRLEQWASSTGLAFTFTNVPPLPEGLGLRVPKMWQSKDSIHWDVRCKYEGTGFSSRFSTGKGLRDLRLRSYFSGTEPWSGRGIAPGREFPPRRGTIAWQELLDRIPESPPGVGCVLDCWLSDFYTLQDCRTFESWAREFGLSTDSREAEWCYESNCHLWQSFNALLPKKVVEEFMEFYNS